MFEEHRSFLLGLAYRLLGSMWDAEDVVQEAFLRWSAVDVSAVREPRAYLVTVVTRLALDQLRSARVTREAYPGPWLPEPVASDAFGPLETAELRDSLSYATLHLMERLAPPERAVFVLREGFGLPYEEIASIVGQSAANCRQLHRRAAKYLSAGRDRFTPSPSEHEELLSRFLSAARSGDLDALESLLSEDVVAYNDGGGKVRAAPHPVTGRTNVMAFISGLMARHPLERAELTSANGAPAVWTVIGGQEQLVALSIRDGRITGVFGVLNPDKLSRVRPYPPARDTPATP